MKDLKQDKKPCEYCRFSGMLSFPCHFVNGKIAFGMAPGETLAEIWTFPCICEHAKKAVLAYNPEEKSEIYDALRRINGDIVQYLQSIPHDECLEIARFRPRKPGERDLTPEQITAMRESGALELATNQIGTGQHGQGQAETY